MTFACEGMAQNAILGKIAKIYVFWLFNRLFYSDRNGDIWPKICHLGNEEAQKTIEHQRIVFRAHFEKIEKKNSHFYPKNALKIFKVDFHRAILPGQQIDIARRYILSGPPNPCIVGFITSFLPHSPTCWIFMVENPKFTFFGFFHLSGPLKWIT